MLIITGTIKLASEAEAQRVTEALIRRAAHSRADDGNIDYAFACNLEDPSEIRLIEKWQSEELLNAHLQQPDEEFNAILATAKIERALVVASDVTGERELMKR